MAEMVISVVDVETRKIKVERVQGGNRQEIFPRTPRRDQFRVVFSQSAVCLFIAAPTALL